MLLSAVTVSLFSLLLEMISWLPGPNKEYKVSEAMRQLSLQKDRVITITREGDSFHYKTHIGEVDVDFSEKIGEQTEWEDKEKSPIVHVRTIPAFKDGVWVQDITPIEAGDGKRYIVTLSRHEDEIYWDLSIPEVPSVTARRHWKKC